MDVEFAKVAKLLASQARSAMLGALLDGRAMTAGELARAAAVRPATASTWAS
jgi:DNA-binding transcriptional ArsR family regulator